MAHLDPARLAAAPISDAPAQELAWFAIRQPAVVRFLERRLWSADGDAFAVALDAVCRLHAVITLGDGLEPVRVDDRLLCEGPSRWLHHPAWWGGCTITVARRRWC
jgi:hypothetical protein